MFWHSTKYAKRRCKTKIGGIYYIYGGVIKMDKPLGGGIMVVWDKHVIRG
jgi:hypothetical protein